MWQWFKSAEPFFVVFNTVIYGILVFHLQRTIYRLQRRLDVLAALRVVDRKQL